MAVAAVPELPEVETIRRQLEPRLIGRSIVDAWGFVPPKFDQAPLAIGGEISGVDRRGKFLLIGLSEDRELIVHLGMTGALEMFPSNAYRPGRYVRAWWALNDASTLQLHDVRRFGRVAVVCRGHYASLPTLAALGPEPLASGFSAMGLRKALNASSARVKTQLLNQRVVAGVGNIYADEALWQARVHPGARSVTAAQATRLHRAIRQVISTGIDNGGTTLRDYRGVDGQSGENQHHLDCYGRADEPCPRCATTLRKALLDARTSTFCPKCQRP